MAVDDEPITSPSQLDVPVTSPDQVDPSLAPQQPASPASGDIEMPDDYVGRSTVPLPPGSSEGSSVSIKTKGLPGGAKRANSLFGRAEEQAKLDAAPMNAEYDQQKARSDAAYGEERSAVQEEGQKTQQYHEAEAELLHRQNDFYQHQAQLEQKAADNAKADQAQYVASYREQLAGVRQLMAQSGDPLGNLTFGQKAGLGFASFAQGFLAARGINIDVQGQIDRWVNRSIAEHQQNIQNARESANDSLHLYDIARQTSQDDYEARQRYRGFVIEGMKGSIQENAARFNSQIATAHANAAIAKLDIEANANEAGIAERRHAMTFGFDKLRIEEAGEQGKLEIQAADLALKRQERQDKLNKEKAVKPSGILPVPDPGATIPDPKTGKVTGVKNMWGIDPNAAPAEQTAAAKIANDTGNTYSTIKGEVEKLRQLRAPAMEGYAARYAPAFAKKMFDEDYRTYEAAKLEALMDARHAMAGANLTETEVKDWNSILEDDSGWQSGGNAKKLELFEKHYRDRFVNTMNQTVGIIPLAEGDQTVRAINNAGNDTDANYNARMNHNLPETKVIAKETGEAAQDKALPAVDVFERGDVLKEPWAEHMRNMAEAAIDPDRLLKKYKSEESPEEIKKDAAKQLKGLADDESIPTIRREYAKHLLDRLEQNPDILHEDLLDPEQLSLSTPAKFRADIGKPMFPRHEDK